MKGLVLAGTASNVGKTVATLATIRAFEAAGQTVQPAKAGPDFIDASHHAAIADQPSRTLDVWLAGREGTQRNYHRGEGDICVIEGVMGLYDGAKSSTAAVAAALDLPVILVVDATAGMESVGATALGFREFTDRVDHSVEVAGVIAQRAHEGRHEQGVRSAIPDELTYCGHIPPHEGLEIPDRHLGLFDASEAPIDPAALDEAASHLEPTTMGELARTPPNPGSQSGPPETDVTIAVAEDAAFRFVYPATRERLRAGSDVVSFSPTAGDPLPACDGCYLPGGYPELYAETLSDCPALETLADRAAEGLPIYGECGGLMSLAESLRTTDGESFDMAGVLPTTVRMYDTYQALDHVTLKAPAGTLTADRGMSLRGHEFHYSEADPGPDARYAFRVEQGRGIDGDHDGLTEYQTLGTYAHVHPASGAFDRFLETTTNH